MGRSEHLGAEAPAAGEPFDVDDERAVVDLIYDRSGGNALYATYLCRYAARISPLDADDTAPVTASDIVHRLTLVPDTATDVDACYAYLLGAMTADQQFAIGTLASTYSSDRDGTLHLAIQLGELRLRSQRGDMPPDMAGQVAENLEQDHDVFWATSWKCLPPASQPASCQLSPQQ